MLPKVVLSWIGRVVGIAAVMASPLVARAAEAADDGPATTKQVHRATVPGVHARNAKKKRGSRHEDATTKLERSRSDEHESKTEAKPVKVSKIAPSKSDDSDSSDVGEQVIAEHASSKAPPKPSKTPLPTIAAAATVPRMEVIATCEAPPIQHEGHAKVERHEAKAEKAEHPVEAKAEHPVEAKTERHEAKAEHQVDAKAERQVEARAEKKSDADKPRLEKTRTDSKRIEHVRSEAGHAVEPRSTPIVKATTRTTDEPEGIVEAKPKAKHGKAPCLHAPIDVTRGSEDRSFSLTKCDGSAAPLAIEEMSVLTRPGTAPLPSEPIAALAAKSDKKENDELAPGIKKIDGRLVERLQLMVDHFAKPGKTPKMFVVSGYRPTSKGSFHAMGRAIDFRLDGVENTDLVAFCKTLDDTGCGFYPNSSFIHVDVRDSGTGHVAWIDASHTGDKPDYVASWPPPPKADDEDPVKILAKMDQLEILPTEKTSHKAKSDEDAKDDDADSEPGVLLNPMAEDKKRHGEDE